MFPHKDCKEFIDKIFLAFDADKSGFVTFSELMIAISLSGRADPVKKLHLVFNIYDRNHNGRIEKKEIDEILNSIKQVSSLDNIDLDEDGIMNWDKDNNGYLNEDEFVNFVMSNPNLKKFYLNLIKVHD